MTSVPTHTQLMWPTLKALKSMGGSATGEELLNKVIELESFSPEVQSIPHGNGRRTKLEYRLAWAKTYLKGAGALENSSRGVWAVTKNGERLTEEDVKKIPSEVRRLYRDKKSGHETNKEQQAPEAATSGDLSETEGWKDQLLEVLGSLSPSAFERLAQRVLRESGFAKVEVTGKSGDGGIDGIGILKVNLLSFPVIFQCKRWKRSVSASEIRDFRGAMVGRSEKGLFLTIGTFTPDAQKEATRDGAPAIDLIGGDQLCDLLKQLKLGLKTEIVESVVVDPDWFARI